MPAPRQTHSAQSLVERLTALAASTGRDDIPLAEFTKATGISKYFIHRAMGDYNALRVAAGLRPSFNKRLDNDELLRRLRDACLKAGRLLSVAHLQRFGACDRSVYYSRWRNWRGTLAALRDWVEIHDPAFPYVPLLAEKPNTGRGGALSEVKAAGARYGAPLQVGPLLHEPTNEMGVVALFAGLATELGFGIERLQPGFPDCEAKQRVAGGWRRVRIEFEFQSRNFQRHNHDPAGCDLIVCWQHNWPEAPLEVIELRSRIAGLRPARST